jgi:osmotically-inducible protein OsmY
VSPNGHGGYADDDTLVARVRSEVLRDSRYKSGEIHVDAYEACVTLRGQIDGESDLRRLVEAARRVPGVRDVRSYLHLPDEPPPNMADVYAQATRDLPAM